MPQKVNMYACYVNRIGRGGRRLQIVQPTRRGLGPLSGRKGTAEDIFWHTGRQRDQADFRIWVVEEYHLVKDFKSRIPSEYTIIKSKLLRWQRKYRNKNVAGLIDQHGGHNRGEWLHTGRSVKIFLYHIHDPAKAQRKTLL